MAVLLLGAIINFVLDPAMDVGVHNAEARTEKRVHHCQMLHVMCTALMLLSRVHTMIYGCPVQNT